MDLIQYPLHEEEPVADLVADQFGQGGRAERARARVPAAGLAGVRRLGDEVGRRLADRLGDVGAVAAVADEELAWSARTVRLTRTNIPCKLCRSVTTQRWTPPTDCRVISACRDEIRPSIGITRSPSVRPITNRGWRSRITSPSFLPSSWTVRRATGGRAVGRNRFADRPATSAGREAGRGRRGLEAGLDRLGARRRPSRMTVPDRSPVGWGPANRLASPSIMTALRSGAARGVPAWWVALRESPLAGEDGGVRGPDDGPAPPRREAGGGGRVV